MEAQDNHFNDMYKKNFHFMNKCTFVVCSMFTPDNHKLIQCADRLARSCEKYDLPYCIYRVPEIHKSLSPVGKDDPSFTRTNLIYSNLKRFPDKNILCLDVDMFFMDYPTDITKISNSGYDFAVYNWVNDGHNEAYIPINWKMEIGNRYSDFYIFSHWIGYQCSEQLICSGGVQFYRNSSEAMHLLESWQAFIVQNPDYAEDQCLDFVYNNFIAHQRHIRASWLDKSYLRFPWWPHVKPVIIHPGLPSGARPTLTEINNRKRFYPEKCLLKSSNDFIFPQDCIIDTKERVLLKIVNNQVVGYIPLQNHFWIYSENVEMG